MKTKWEPKKRCSPYDDDAWRVFRIMSEFVDGFEHLSEIGTAVTIFGSARSKPGTKEYQVAQTTANLLAKAGYSVITGGGPGLMEAANRGASLADGVSIGLNIQLPMEQVVNAYVNLPIGFRYFFVRKVMFLKYASAVVVMPGGFGTMDECFEALTLIQTGKIRPIPVILVNTDYWKGLIDWMESAMLKNGLVSKDELEIVKLMDDPEEIVKEIKKNVKITSQSKANF